MPDEAEWMTYFHPVRVLVTMGVGAHVYDVADFGCGNYVLLFNVLHTRRPLTLLGEAHRILTSTGHVTIMNWTVDPATPYGPPLEMRPASNSASTGAPRPDTIPRPRRSTRYRSTTTGYGCGRARQKRDPGRLHGG